MNKRITRTIAALGSAAVLAPLGGGAQAQEPVACFGAPSAPASYICLVEFQFGADPTNTPTPVVVPGQTVTLAPMTVGVPSQTVGVGSQTVGVPAQSITVPGRTETLPELCVIICVGPFDVTTPTISQTTPGVSQTTPAVSQTIPGASQTTPGASGTIPTQTFIVDVPGVSIPPGEAAVVYYNGKCYRLWPNGTLTTTPATGPTFC